MAASLPNLSLTLLEYYLVIIRLAPDDSLPIWFTSSRFWSVTRTSEELSIVCEEGFAPAGLLSEPGWRALKVNGPLDFNLTGVLSSLLTPLAQAEISVFAISTFDTDYLLIKQSQLEETITALRSAGYQIIGD